MLFLAGLHLFAVVCAFGFVSFGIAATLGQGIGAVLPRLALLYAPVLLFSAVLSVVFIIGSQLSSTEVLVRLSIIALPFWPWSWFLAEFGR